MICLSVARLVLNGETRFLFTLHTSYDGSFQLSHKKKPYDAWDICLSDGRMYFVRDEPFKKYFKRTMEAGNRTSTKVR
jgi:hypothetical protein